MNKVIVKPKKKRRFIQICIFSVHFEVLQSFFVFKFLYSKSPTHEKQLSDDVSPILLSAKRWNSNFNIIEKVWAFELLWWECSLCKIKKTFQSWIYRSMENATKGYETRNRLWANPSNIKSEWISLQKEKRKAFNELWF